jgi:chromosome segregation ATPase
LTDLERALVEATTVRARILASREKGISDASALADEIARLKARAGDVARADPALERRLQQFDRLSAGLDQADARLREQDRLIDQLRAAFDAEADAESRRVTEARGIDPGAVASRLSDIDERRRRVEQLIRAAPTFRPVLDIRLAPSDTAADIDRKLTILVAERERATAELSRLARELSVLDARETLKRRLLDSLESALREVPADMRVLRRQADDLTQSLRDINRQRQDLLRSRSDVQQAIVQLNERQGELQARRRSLTGRIP